MEYSKHIEQIIIASSSLLVFLIVSSAIVKVLQVLAENRIKRLLIEEGHIEKPPGFMSNDYLVQQYLLSNLKWAILLVFLAAGLMSCKWVVDPNLADPVFYGYLIFSCSLGLGAYYFIAKRVLVRNHRES